MVCLVALWVVSVALPWADASGGGVTHAVLINGGSHPHANSLRHLQHLQEMVALLESRGIPRQRRPLFAADGEDETPDLAVRDVVPTAFGLLATTHLGQLLQPPLAVIDTRWDGMPRQPARQTPPPQWFATPGQDLPRAGQSAHSRRVP